MNTCADYLISEFDLKLCREISGNLSCTLFAECTKRNARRDRSYHELLFPELILFVALALYDRMIPIRPALTPTKIPAYDKSFLAKNYFSKIRDFVELVKMLPPEYVYHEYFAVFHTCCLSLGLLDNDFYWSDAWDNRHISVIHPDTAHCAVLFNKLVELIRAEIDRTGAHASFRKRQSRLIQRKIACCSYVDALFELCSRHVVIRIDLGYREDLAAKISLVDAKKDIAHLYSNKRANQLFKFITGYIIKLEHGVDKGIHFHALFFFDGSECNGQKHVWHAMQIGEYWKNTITQERGIYWNCNAKIDDFKKMNRCGIGVINHDEIELRYNLKNYVVGYLCKSDQFIRPKIGKSIRRLFKGKMPKIPLVKRGAPRRGSQSSGIWLSDV